MGDGGGRIVLRIFREEDGAQVEGFRCAPYGDKAAKAAQEIIRRAPRAIGSGQYCAEGEISVAQDGDEIVGVVVYGIEVPDTPVVTIFSLGVLLRRQREGIGTLLKRAVMAEVAHRSGWPTTIASEVHRVNYKMLGLNEKLGVQRVRDPADGEYYLCAIAVEADMSEVVARPVD
jgi:ribosomal protein S18 acetylase RimI-like enzyme